jgi:endoglucanase
MKRTIFMRGKAFAMAAVLALGVMGIGGCGSQKSKSSSDDGSIRKELTAVEVTELMGNGINLGNTMEAYGHGTLGTEAEVSAYETYWGQPVTTQESISGMKAAGFDTIRIPVAWTNMMNFEDGDYTIGKAYLDRVEEIVNYARNEDMYVIINDHWDGGWWGMFGSASEETREAAMEMYTSMWKQIAERFQDYSDYVIFESANEELGYRLNDTDIATDSGTLSDEECYEVTNEINQAFVDTVRATGGNNEQRFLLIAGFGTDIVNTVNNSFVMPEDSATSKLLVSVHYYDPSGYCINSSIASWGTKDDYDDQNRMLAKMQKFTTQGYGVVIGEYGVLMEDGNRKEGMETYVANLLDNCDLYGYCPVLWDCNNLYSRTDGKIIYEDMAALYQEHSYAAQADLTQEQIQTQAQADMDEAYANADDGFALSDDTAMAWIMFNSSDWNTIYSVGDVYDPTSSTAGVEAVDVEVTGEGTYTVSLDFTGIEGGYANSTVFCALAIANGETLYPGYYIDIKEILINGEPYTMKGQPYTTTDDGLCTRVNLYNGWVSQIPDEARVQGGDLTDATPTLLDPEELGEIQQISVTFDYVAGE